MLNVLQFGPAFKIAARAREMAQRTIEGTQRYCGLDSLLSPAPFQGLHNRAEFMNAARQGDTASQQILLSYAIMKYQMLGRKRKNGDPAFTHSLEVANMMGRWPNTGIPQAHRIIAGLLHDVPEDSRGTEHETTPDDLSEVFDLPEPPAAAVGSMTKREGEPEFDYHVRCGRGGFLEQLNKYVDMLCNRNADLARLDKLTPKEREKLAIYETSIPYFLALMFQKIPAGTPMSQFIQMYWKGKPEFAAKCALHSRHSTERSPCPTPSEDTAALQVA